MIADRYTRWYQADKATRVYPVEFVVRAFLGTYPGLSMPKGHYRGKRVLDLGYGDGRNMPLLNDLGMKVHGVEISENINRRIYETDHLVGRVVKGRNTPWKPGIIWANPFRI